MTDVLTIIYPLQYKMGKTVACIVPTRFSQITNVDLLIPICFSPLINNLQAKFGNDWTRTVLDPQVLKLTLTSYHLKLVIGQNMQSVLL